MSEQNPLPPGWVWTRLGEIAVNTRKRVKPGKTNGIPFVGLEHVEAHTMRLIGTVPASTMKSMAESFQPGDVLYGRLRPYLNKVYLATFEGLCSSEFIVFRKHENLDPGFLRYLLNDSQFVSFTSNLNTGDRPRVNEDQIADYRVALPPLPEQRRIVAKIEELFTRLDAGVAALKRVQAALKRYKVAVLKAACEGRLVPQDPNDEPADALLQRILAERRAKWEADLRAKGKDPAKAKYEEPATPDASELPELPKGWVWATAGSAFDISYGLSESLSKTKPDNILDVAVIRIPNVTEFGTLDLSELKYYPLESSTKRKLLLRKGDVLFNWRNAPKWIGRSTVFEMDGEYINASFLLKLRPYLQGYSRFIAIYMNFLRLKGYFVNIVNNAVNQANFNATRTASVSFPLPPLTEQNRIIAEVERRLSVVQELETTVAANLARAARLRQSILKCAFEGKLVPQDPNDEPANVMVEQIRAEREGVGEKQLPLTAASNNRLPAKRGANDF